MFPQKILAFHGWEKYIENAFASLRFGISQPAMPIPKYII
jgi:hypothetical protein